MESQIVKEKIRLMKEQLNLLKEQNRLLKEQRKLIEAILEKQSERVAKSADPFEPTDTENEEISI